MPTAPGCRANHAARMACSAVVAGTGLALPVLLLALLGTSRSAVGRRRSAVVASPAARRERRDRAAAAQLASRDSACRELCGCMLEQAELMEADNAK